MDTVKLTLVHHGQEILSELPKAQHIVECHDNVQFTHTVECSISPIVDGNMACCRPSPTVNSCKASLSVTCVSAPGDDIDMVSALQCFVLLSDGTQGNLRLEEMKCL